MAIPDYQTLMLPFIRLLADGKEHGARDAVEQLNDEFGLSPEERQQHIASGPQTVMRNRTGWVCTYLKKAGLIESTRRGVFVITERGLSVLASSPERIDIKYLEQFPEFVAFRELRGERSAGKPSLLDAALGTTPDEALDAACQQLRVDLELEVLEQVKLASPAFFEHLVVELLVRMGYGGSLRDAGQAVGKSGDGGIDGIIKEDRLGLGRDLHPSQAVGLDRRKAGDSEVRGGAPGASSPQGRVLDHGFLLG